MTEAHVKEYPYCFGCGNSNPTGLRLKLRMDDEHLVTEFVPQGDHQGWPGIVHGGIIASLLYEVMENFPHYRGVIAMMKSMETRFRRPAATGKRILAKAGLMEQSGRNMKVSATLTNDEGELIAAGEAVLVVLSQNQLDKLGLS